MRSILQTVWLSLLMLAAFGSNADQLDDAGWSQTGKASYYASRLHGRPTASGERYDQTAMTAAHPSLPFGSLVRVTNLYNGRSVVLRINDRGPFVGGRVIDVSRSAAEQLGMLRAGSVRVQLELVESQD